MNRSSFEQWYKRSLEKRVKKTERPSNLEKIMGILTLLAGVICLVLFFVTRLSFLLSLATMVLGLYVLNVYLRKKTHEVAKRQLENFNKTRK